MKPMTMSDQVTITVETTTKVDELGRIVTTTVVPTKDSTVLMAS